MNAIMGYAQLLQSETVLDSDQSAYVEIIHRSGAHLLGLMNAILDMSRLEAKRETLQLAGVDLRRMLAEVAEQFRRLAMGKGLALEVQVESSLPELVRVDASKCRQVLENLLSNAIKFTTLGGVHVTASAVAGESGVALVTVVVEDTGVGMASEDAERIFDAFERTAQAAHAGGTGLGMTISRSYARMMGGDVSVVSALGRGSVFTFTFQVAPEQSTALQDVAASLGGLDLRTALATVPSALRGALHEATIGVRIEDMEALIDQIAAFAPGAAEVLRALAASYDYEEISEALGSLESDDP